MINKQVLWFLTLFSIILVLSVYYIAMPNNTLATLKENTNDVETINIKDTDSLASLRVLDDEEIASTMNELQSILLNDKATLEEKNNAYEKIQNINSNKGKEESIEKIITDTFKLQSFVKIDKDNIKITISKKDVDAKFANQIIRKIQEQYTNKMYITIKFQ